MTKVVILCGGLGTRIGHETKYKPKPMIKIDDKPIIWHIMKIYKNYGYNDFILSAGYKHEMIKNYFKDTSDFTVKICQYRIEYRDWWKNFIIEEIYKR